MILEALWQARVDILLALGGMILAGIGLGIEISEHRRLARMARDCEAGRTRS